MDRKWMSKDRMHDDYEKGVHDFVEFAIQHARDSNNILCPCLECCFHVRVNAHELKDHLLVYGIDKKYTNWVRHVEKGDLSDNWGSGCYDSRMNYEVEELENVNIDQPNLLTEMNEILGDCPEMFKSLSTDSKQPLYSDCNKYSRLSAVLKLYNLKASNGWSDKSFSSLLELLKDMLPEDNVLPERTYEAKKMLSSIGLNYEKIHACPNDCILYRKEYASLKCCPVCNVSRYQKKEKVPAKVMWYFPIVPRFRRLFSNEDDAKNLIWHASEERVHDGKLRHPADSPQWLKLDREFSEFGQEARNLRLVLSTDGMNPYRGQSSTHSTWPVILSIYNLSPELCMKRKNMLLSILISGPKQPGNDIDVYLAPLIEDLKLMWDKGVEVFDAYRNENFNLKAVLFGTINDFPAYGNLSGYSVKGSKACPICEEHTTDKYLNNSHKTVYLGHRKFLPRNHPYRKMKKAFNGESEEGRSVEAQTGEEVLNKVEGMNVRHGKGDAHGLPTSGFKKKSIFFDLPYWKILYVRHFLDVMHIEKNVCDSLIGTLLNVPGKTKDHLRARKDMAEMKIRPELTPKKKNNRTYLPPASHTLSRKEKKAFCEFLRAIKVPEGYSSNIRNLVSMKDLKLIGLKSHDCHILMERILPLALHSILPERVRYAITKLCLFFTEICSRVIDPGKLRLLQREVVVTLCQLEMYFPPSFFDIMVHLIVHLVRETELCGPAYLRWMYPIERYMKVLKGYVANRSRPEGCIVERYIVEEALNFCGAYVSKVNPIHSKSIGRHEEKGISGNTVVSISRESWRQAHLYVLHNSSEVQPYVKEHKNILMNSNPNKNETWIAKEHNRCFIEWLKDVVSQKLERHTPVSDRLKWLSRGPGLEVLSYTGYQINGHTFYTKERDDQTTVQNSGVTLIAESIHASSAKDKNPIVASMSYFGVVECIWELDYKKFRVPVFGCKWADNNSGVQIDDFGFTLVDFSKVGSKNDIFILASQAKQVFYVSNPIDKKWCVVMSAEKRRSEDEHNEDDVEDNVQDRTFSISSQLTVDDPTEDDLYVRRDHNDGIWIKRARRRYTKLTRVQKTRQQAVNPSRKKRKR